MFALVLSALSLTPLLLLPFLYCLYHVFIVLDAHNLWSSYISFHCTFVPDTSAHMTKKP